MIQCLLVAGEKQARDCIRVGLEEAAVFQVDVTEDAWAVDLAKAKAYEVVIADSKQADGSDGLELLRRIREVLPSAELLLVARSKVQSRYITRDKQKLGIYALVQFPIEPLEFFRTLTRLSDRLAGATAA